jgi:hypothetical protein
MRTRRFYGAAARTIFERCEHRLIDLPLVEIVLAGILAAAIVLALVIWFSRWAMTPLILEYASVSRPSGQWRDDDYDVLENGVVVGRIFCLDAVGPRGRPWMWASGHNGEIREQPTKRLRTT